MQKDQILPNDVDIERNLLASIIQLQIIETVRELLVPETFFSPFHRDVYRAIASIDNKGGKPDLLQIIDEMKRLNLQCDVNKLTDLSELWGGNDIERYAEILVELQKRRELIVEYEKIKALALNRTNDINDILKEAEDGIKQISCDRNATYSTIREAIEDAREQMKLNASDSKQLSGSKTGFGKFDERSGGLQRSNLIIIAGEPGHGKTSLSISIVLNATKNGDAIAVYSLEMGKHEIAARMMSIKSGIPANQIMYNKLMQEHFEIIDNNISGICDRKIFFDDRSTSSIDTIIASIRTLRHKHNINGAIIDYLQILNVNMKGVNKEQQMGEVARRLKNLAKELDIWIIALSQLSRDDSSPEPHLNRLRGSGQIAEAADIVILVYRPELKNLEYRNYKNYETKDTALFDVAKGRNIGVFQFLCRFSSKTTHFYEANDIEMIKINNGNNHHNDRYDRERPF